MRFRHYICQSFHCIEYAIAIVVTLVLSLAMYGGLIHLFGPADRYGQSDSAIYDRPTEEEFIDFLRECGTYDSNTVQADLDTYRYHHSFRRRFDRWLEQGWMVLSFAVVTVSVVQFFKLYRRLQCGSMRCIRKLLASQEVRASLGVLEDALYTFCAGHPFCCRCAACDLVRPYVESGILGHHSDFTSCIQKGISPRQYVYSQIANIAGDLLETSYSPRPGYLGSFDREDLYQLFCHAVAELVRIGAMTPDLAEDRKAALAKGIQEVG